VGRVLSPSINYQVTRFEWPLPHAPLQPSINTISAATARSTPSLLEPLRPFICRTAFPAR
jgi:hypothetical protein